MGAFHHPDLSSYSQQKSLPLVKETEDDLGNLDRFAALDARVGASDVPHYLVRIWDHFYSLRVSAALEFSNEYPRVLSLFPGNTVYSPSGESRFRYRGSLAFEQFLELFRYQQGSPCEGLQGIASKKRPVDETPFWPWQGIQMPRLQFVTADYDAVLEELQDSETIRSCATDDERDCFLANLIDDALAALNSADRSTVSALTLVHRAWCDTAPPVYSKFAIAVVTRAIAAARPRLNRKNLLPFLFELESFASYETYVGRILPVASGWYSNTWLDVGFMPLSQIRATELCVRERLVQELFNLPDRGFAPVVVNEFDSVADGNHRVTSSWIWNILKNAMHTDWSLENPEFMQSVREYVAAHSEALGSVSLYESLKQLASFLQEEAVCHRLNHVLKPMMKRTRAIRKLPVVMLPEYSMGTVEKGSYDRFGAMLRVPPSLYAELAQSSDLVLPPRASYHFTDAVPMPWFEVVKQKRFHHMRAFTENRSVSTRSTSCINIG